jgi:hypothetical protein
VFIGPVQIVEDYLNYTKFNYFSLYDVAELRVGDERKKRSGAGFSTVSRGLAFRALWKTA